MRRWSSPAHSRASKLGGSNERHRTAGTTDIQCAVGGRAAVPVRLTQGEGAAVPRASGHATPLYVADQENLSRLTASESSALHARAKQGVATGAEVAYIRCAVRAGRESLDSLRVAKRRRLLFFGPQIGYLPMLEHHSPYSDAVCVDRGSMRCGGPDMPTGGLLSLGLTRRHRWAGAVSSPFTLSSSPPKHASSRTHSLFYLSENPRHPLSVQMEILKQGQFLEQSGQEMWGSL